MLTRLERGRLAKSVPKARGYYDNILKSPLLNFGNYPKSILKRLASRGEGSIRKSQITTAQSINNQVQSEHQKNESRTINDNGFSSNERSQESLANPEHLKAISPNVDISPVYTSNASVMMQSRTESQRVELAIKEQRKQPVESV